MDGSGGRSISRAELKQGESTTKLLSIPLALVGSGYAAFLTRLRFLLRNKLCAEGLDSCQDDTPTN